MKWKGGVKDMAEKCSGRQSFMQIPQSNAITTNRLPKEKVAKLVKELQDNNPMRDINKHYDR